MREVSIAGADFEAWRAVARGLLAERVAPEEVVWSERVGGSLFRAAAVTASEGASDGPSTGSGQEGLGVPKRFVEAAGAVACHRDSERWGLLYRVLWRMVRGGERGLMDVEVDEDVYRLLLMERAVRRDVHKMHAFVRFRKVVGEDGDHYVAWHRPDHFIVRRAAGFFRSRFGVMRWTILTPDESVGWDGRELTFGPGVERSAAPGGDELEELWRAYYGATFNPARIKLRQMRKELPVRHWATLPETTVIEELLKDAPRRVEAMMKKAACPTATSAADYLPDRMELPVLAKAAEGCRGCGIYCNATQVVFGEGPVGAACMFVGEQPGDQEDLAGRPFVGPAGELLNAAMEEAGVSREQVYVTNAVKHFKWEPRGKRRIHAKPSAREVAACRPWLEAEIKVVKPRMIVCLGATASQSLMGAAFRLTQHRGEVMKETGWAPWVLATVHPSSLLRMPDRAAREAGREQFVSDLRMVARELKRSKKD